MDPSRFGEADLVVESLTEIDVDKLLA
jgi:hypothetical protein